MGSSGHGGLRRSNPGQNHDRRPEKATAGSRAIMCRDAGLA